jgi:hypothetical protein
MKARAMSYFRHRNPKEVDWPLQNWLTYWFLYWTIFDGLFLTFFWVVDMRLFLTETEFVMAGTQVLAGMIGGSVYNKTKTWKYKPALLFWIIFWIVSVIVVGIIYKLIGYLLSPNSIIYALWWCALGVWGGMLGQTLLEASLETDRPIHWGILRSIIGSFWYFLFSLIYRVIIIAFLAGIFLFITNLMSGNLIKALSWLAVCLGSVILYKIIKNFILPT